MKEEGLGIPDLRLYLLISTCVWDIWSHVNFCQLLWKQNSHIAPYLKIEGKNNLTLFIPGTPSFFWCITCNCVYCLAVDFFKNTYIPKLVSQDPMNKINIFLKTTIKSQSTKSWDPAIHILHWLTLKIYTFCVDLPHFFIKCVLCKISTVFLQCFSIFWKI